MKQIRRYTLLLTGLQSIAMPNDAVMCSVHLQPNGLPCLFVEGPPTGLGQQVPYNVSILGTGEGFDPAEVGPYVGTISVNGGGFSHVFVRKV